MAQVYPYGQAVTVNNPEDLYQLQRYLVNQGKDPQEVAQQLSNNPFGVSFQQLAGGTSQYGGTDTSYGGSSAAAAPTVTADLSGKLAAINQLYDLIYGDLASQTQSRKAEMSQQYDKQRGDLQTQYEKNQAVLPNAFAAQGTRYSSYYENAAKDAADTYGKNQDAIAQDQAAKEAQLGQSYQTALAGYQSARSGLSSFNPKFTGTQSDLMSVQGQLDQRANELSAARAGLQTDQGYRATLNSIAPTQNMGASALQEQLAKITNASIPGYAKDTIAQGLIKQSGQDPKYYQDYYEKLKGGLSTPLQ